MSKGFNGIFIIATNSVDVMTKFVLEHSKLDSTKVIGTGTLLDTARLKNILSEKLNVKTTDIDAYVFGEHGDSSFIVWSDSNIGALVEEKETIEQLIRDCGQEIIKRKGMTEFGIGMTLTKITDAIINDLNITLPVSTLDKDNNVYELVDGKYVKTDYIKMVNYAKDAVSINKLDSDTNEFVSGAKLVVKNNKGEQVAAWTTTKESYYINLDEGEYTLEEVEAPNGYVLNTTPISFKIDENGKLFIKNSNGEYVSGNGVIMYNKPEEVIVVPPTGLSSTLTYVVGSLVILGGAIALYRNEKKC